MPNDLDSQFWRACDILRRDDNTQGLLDYVEQISWLLFLKSFEDMEDTRVDEAAYRREVYARVIDGYYRWSVWTGGRVLRARSTLREADAALRMAQKALVAAQINGGDIGEAGTRLEQAQATVAAASSQVESEESLQRTALEPLLHGSEDDRQTAEALIGSLGGRLFLRFLNEHLFPYLRGLGGSEAQDVIRQIFEESPSKMVKDGSTLLEAALVVDGIDFHATENVHTLSHLYESMLARMGREGGMSGEMYTPRPIVKFMVQMVDPQIGETVYDPATGSAGFLVEAYQHMLERQVNLTAEFRTLRDRTFYGQEKKPLSYLLGVMNCVLHDIPVPHIVRKNTLSDDVRKYGEKDRFHIILTNPPFGGTEKVDAVKDNFRYPSSATSILFVQHIMARLRRDGRVGMVIDEGVLFKSSERAYAETKRELLEEFNLLAVVSLPAGVFANVVASGAGPKTDLLFFNRLGPTKQIWYYDVRSVGFSLTRTQKPIPENDLPDCLTMFHVYQDWLRTPIDTRPAQPLLNERCWIVPLEELVQKNYDLSARNPKRTNDFSHRPPEELAADIADKQTRIAELIEEIQELLVGDNDE